jgi:hypothetical protein
VQEKLSKEGGVAEDDDQVQANGPSQNGALGDNLASSH